jgi:chorismate dehydratase
VKPEERQKRAESPVALSGPVVARIPYLNAEPFYASWESLPAASVDLVPRRLGEEARAGRVDAGLMAVVDYFSLASEFERVGNLGVACKGAVDSVLLLASTPLDQLENGRVLLTTESSTSVELCRLLLAKRYGLTGLRYERRDLGATGRPEKGEAWLVIGDAALSARRSMPECVALDLGEAWREWTGLPFVYAVWTVRKSLPAENRQTLLGFLTNSLADGEDELDRIADRCAAAHDGKLGDTDYLTRYLEHFVYRLGPFEEEGLARFKEHLEENSCES